MLNQLLTAATLFASLFVVSSVTELPLALEHFIESQEELVKDIAAHATELHAQRVQFLRSCECSKHACSNDFLDAPCVTQFGTPGICEVEGRRLDNTTSIFRTPPGTNPDDLSDTLKESICVYQHMEDVARNYVGDSGWTYLGTRDGHFRRFPATATRRGVEGGDEHLNFCNTYDPRLRPWYVGATTGQKDIVLVVDKSLSMVDQISTNGNSSTKWDLTTSAVLDILDTFTFADFVNVVMFSTDAEPLWTESGLVRGQRDNIEQLKQRVSQQFPNGKTNFAAAFETAFGLLTDGCDEEGACSNCQKIILFLTDGRDTTGEDDEGIRPSAMAGIIDDLQNTMEQQTGRRASIFTYSMSIDADDAIPRQIACANDGAWAFIGPHTNTQDALNSYYLYIAAGMRTESPIWIEPYEDASDLGMVTTVAIPFYAVGTDEIPDVFLGVAAHTVMLEELQISGLTEAGVLEALISRAANCTLSRTTPCALQVYRNANDARSQCPDPFPIANPTTSESEQDEVECYQHGAHIYKRFSDEVTWENARARCEEDEGQLVSISDEAELAFVANMATMDGSWIGARRWNGRSSFSWTNSSMEDLGQNSSYWGVQEPVSLTNAPECAAIDTRGVISNLAAKHCDLQLSFICKYTTDFSCTDGIARIPNKGYFYLPSVDQCSSAEILDETQPVREAQMLNSDDVMCDLGSPKPSEEVICCAESDSSDEVPVYAWVLMAVGIFSVIVVSVLLIWQHRRFYVWFTAYVTNVKDIAK